MTRFTIHSSRRRYFVPLLALLLVLAGSLAVLAAAPPNIDTFVDNQTEIVVNGGASASGSAVTGTATEILGQYRDIYVHNVVGLPNLVAKVGVAGGMYTHNQDAGLTANSVLTYDGSGGGYPNTTFNGLGNPGVDLTQGGTKNGFRFRLNLDDLAMNVRIKVYQTDNNDRCSQATLPLFPGGIVAGNPQDIFVEFPTIIAQTQTGSGCSADADFSKVGAVEFEFIGYNGATDMQIDTIDISQFDWGDLPETVTTCLGSGRTSTYATTAACEGPRHVTSNNLYLGAGVDPAPIPTPDYRQGEQNGQPSTNATGDDFTDSPDDEDGVVPHSFNDTNCTSNVASPVWQNGTNGGRVKVTLYGEGHLVGWIDFNRNGFHPGSAFPFVATEAIINEVVGTANTTTIICRTFDIPLGTIQTPSVPLYARFRFFPKNELTLINALYAFDGRGGFGTTISPQSKNGEVEDYVWYFTPTAITLAQFYAEQMGDYVRVTWETTTELDNRGFNLYRGTSPDEPDRQLNATLIPSQSQGSTGGFTYTWDDYADLIPGTTYYYWLDDVDISGVVTRHGPVSVDFIVPTAVTLGGMAASPAAGGGLPVAGTLLALLAPLAGALAVRRRAQ